MNRGRGWIAGAALLMAGFALGSFLPRSSARQPEVVAGASSRFFSQVTGGNNPQVILTDSITGQVWSYTIGRNDRVWNDLGNPTDRH